MCMKDVKYVGLIDGYKVIEIEDEDNHSPER